MQQDPTPTFHERLSQVERNVLYLLTGCADSQPLWSLPDIARQVERDGDAEVAVHGLYQAGLAYRTSDGYVFATRAGYAPWR
jgi:hypothetical protein